MSVAAQFSIHSPLCGQSKMDSSSPLQPKSSRTKLFPDGAVPYKSSAVDNVKAAVAKGKPSILHTTWASLISNRSSQIPPHCPFVPKPSTYPSLVELPIPLNLTRAEIQ